MKLKIIAVIDASIVDKEIVKKQAKRYLGNMVDNANFISRGNKLLSIELIEETLSDTDIQEQLKESIKQAYDQGAKDAVACCWTTEGFNIQEAINRRKQYLHTKGIEVENELTTNNT